MMIQPVAALLKFVKHILKLLLSFGAAILFNFVILERARCLNKILDFSYTCFFFNLMGELQITEDAETDKRIPN